MARPKAADHDEKRITILRKAATLIADCGYAGASISMIAQDCRISKSLTYHYYPDKEALLFDIISTHLQNLLQIVEDAARNATDRDARERLECIATALLESYRDHDAEHQVQITSLKLLPPEKQDVLKDLERELVDIFANAIGEALPKGRRSGKLLKPLTMSLFGMLNWHFLWFREGKGLTRSEYARLACDIIVTGASGLMTERVGDSPAKAASDVRLGA